MLWINCSCHLLMASKEKKKITPIKPVYKSHQSSDKHC